MEEEIIRITIDENISQMKVSNVESFDGLCYFFSNNVMCDLLEQGFNVLMLNIRDYTDVNYDHYFLVANHEYLIDLTYSQFLPKEGKIRFFEDFPANILSKSQDGKIILNELINNYYIKLKDNYLNLYLGSFKGLEKKR